MVIKQIFFGIMLGDLFLGEEHMPEGTKIDYDASVGRYAEMCIEAIEAGFAKRGEVTKINYESQDVGGATQYSLKTRVNGRVDHEDVEFVNDIISDVWMGWEWCIEVV